LRIIRLSSPTQSGSVNVPGGEKTKRNLPQRYQGAKTPGQPKKKPQCCVRGGLFASCGFNRDVWGGQSDLGPAVRVVAGRGPNRETEGGTNFFFTFGLRFRGKGTELLESYFGSGVLFGRGEIFSITKLSASWDQNGTGGKARFCLLGFCCVIWRETGAHHNIPVSFATNRAPPRPPPPFFSLFDPLFSIF